MFPAFVTVGNIPCMGWEERGNNGRRYYYVSERRADGRVTKTYLGREGAAMALELDRLAEVRRRVRQSRRALFKAERERLEAHDAPIKELCEAADILARAHLVAAGCHRHKGEWRRAREPAELR